MNTHLPSLSGTVANSDMTWLATCCDNFESYLTGSVSSAADEKTSSIPMLNILSEDELKDLSLRAHDEVCRRRPDGAKESWIVVTLDHLNETYSPLTQRASRNLEGLEPERLRHLIRNLLQELRRRYVPKQPSESLAFLAAIYDHILLEASSETDLTVELARSCFDDLTFMLATPHGLREYPESDLLWLTSNQLRAFAVDICSDMQRRRLEMMLTGDTSRDFSLVTYDPDLHPERNGGREILATLPTSQMEDLGRDVWCELSRRFPEFREEVSTPNRKAARPRSMALLKHTRTPVAFIPPEVLSRIFEYCQDDTRGTCRVAIACSHVCQFWRNIAIGLAAIWNYIDLSHEGCDVFARRSVLTPLRVFLFEPEKKGTLAFYQTNLPKWLNSYSARIQTLQLSASRKTSSPPSELIYPSSPPSM